MTSKAAGQRWIYDIAQDVRFALRLLIKERWFTFSAIGALALGIAVTTTMVTIINGYHFRGLPVDDPDGSCISGRVTRVGAPAGCRIRTTRTGARHRTSPGRPRLPAPS